MPHNGFGLQNLDAIYLDDALLMPTSDAVPSKLLLTRALFLPIYATPKMQNGQASE